jgi:ribose 1,5-bisphosphokinase PhnN
MVSIHLIGLLVDLLVAFYEFVLPGLVFLFPPLAVWLLWGWVVAPRLDYRARERRDRLRHELARQQIRDIERAAVRSMFNVAHAGEVIEGTAAEIEPTRRRR